MFLNLTLRKSSRTLKQYPNDEKNLIHGRETGMILILETCQKMF